uniref:m7GpppN-mRNA hydrolase n=1 Tax=Anopheles atroparvus TaxID=41427 RepID=A0AAG5DNB7_ANOAO
MATNSPVSAVQPAAGTGQKVKQNASFTISSDILDDLASRFIINVPFEERKNLIRICFQVELAHWFYLDFYCSEHKQKCGIKQFAQQIFKHVPFLQPFAAAVDGVLENWKQYKVTVPTYGAILLSEDLKHVLLVQSFWAKSSWGFPKGKINENEEPVNCAIREVYEETGYDIRNLIVPTEYIELVINYQFTRLYLVSGVPLTTVFVPKTRNEIKCCEWFPVDLLPVTKHDNIVKDNHQLTGNSFFMILPFVKRLKKWLEAYQKGKPGKGGGKGTGNALASNSPIFGRESGGKQKIFFDNNITGGSGSKNANQQPLQSSQQQQQDKRQRQRHKSMGELDQPGGARVKSNAGTPQVNQQFYKNSPTTNNQPQYQILKREDTSGAAQQRAGSMVNDGPKDIPSAPSEPLASSKKKQQSKSKPEATPLGSAGSLAVSQVERPGKHQIKRKLFDNLPPSDSVAVDAAGPEVPPVSDPYAEFDENPIWANFKLDFSEIVFGRRPPSWNEIFQNSGGCKL